MMEPLPPGWRKERYNYLVALRMVARWRYGGPHPGIDAKISREARWNADRELMPLRQYDQRPAESPAPPITRRPSNWLRAFPPDDPWLASGFDKPGWGFETSRPNDEFGRVNLPPPPWIAFADLEQLCPGAFGEIAPADPAPKRTGAKQRRAEKILKLAESLGIDPFNLQYGEREKIKRLCLEDPREFTESTFDHAWKALKKPGK